MPRGRRKLRRPSGARTRRNQVDNAPTEWVINMNNFLREGPDFDSGRSWTIYRVPRNMLEVQKSAYIPKIISIGPFHYGDQCLQVMEEHKMRYLLRLLGYTSQENGHQEQNNGPPMPKQEIEISDIHLESLAGAMKFLEKKMRECYSETFDIDSNDFVQMIVIDGCFIIELLRLYHKFDKGEPVHDPIFTTRWMLRTLQRDLLMLQNQLPFFVLKELFKLTSSGEEPSLLELTLKFFDPLMPREEIKLDVSSEDEYDHLLDLFWTSFLSSVRHKKTKSCSMKPKRATSLPLLQERQLIHSARELQEAGFVFQKREGHDLLDIVFEDKVLEIPPLYVDDNTVPLILNFIAFEQCDQKAEPFFTNYFMFFDSLVNSTKDVEILHRKGIINHVLGSDKDVANLFNRLGREIVYDVDDCYLSEQMQGVNNYYKAYYAMIWHVWWRNLIRDYFSSPWTLLSLLGAIFLLLLTVAQTFFQVIAYISPPSP